MPSNDKSEPLPIAFVRQMPTRPQSEGEHVSVWLYLAGLCVTLSGLYAVSFGMEDSGYGMMLSLLAISGYVTSYIFRVRRISMQSLQWPLIIGLLLLIYMALTSNQSLSLLLPSGGNTDRFRSIQFLFAWIAVIHSFILTSDAAILFTCVPCISIIAMVSTMNPNDEIKNAFIVFLAASTFLLVHENYLRTRSMQRLKRSADPAPRYLFGQVLLAGMCVVGAMAAAFLIAGPLQIVGQALSPTPPASPFNNANNKPLGNLPSQMITERNAIDLATGPVTESSVPLMDIRSSMNDLYWRGATFDYYSGQRFENHTSLPFVIGPSRDGSTSDLQSQEFDLNGLRSSALAGQLNAFRIPTSVFELGPREMRGAQIAQQEMHIIGGTFYQMYGAGNVEEIDAPFPSLQGTAAGNISSYYIIRNGGSYQVKSRVANTDPDTLRRAGDDYPPEIARAYLQKAPEGGAESKLLRALARDITRGKKTNYDRAEAIRDYISQNCKYNLQAAPAPRDQDVVEFFLMQSRQGYCDSFGAAMTMLCRYAGIPARLASGFLTGERQPDGNYLVREKDKHIWSEVFFPHIGWVTYDATEGAIDISDHSGGSHHGQAGFLKWLTSNGIGPPFALLAVLLALGYVLKSEVWDRLLRKRRVRGEAGARAATNRVVIETYLMASKRLARRGLTRPLGMTSEEFLRDMVVPAQLAPEHLEAFRTLTALHSRFRYGAEIATEADVQAASEALNALKNGVGREMRQTTTQPAESRA